MFIDLDENTPKWFEMEDGGRVQLKTISVADFKAIRKQSVKRGVEYPLLPVDDDKGGKAKKTPKQHKRFEFDIIDEDLQNELYWDAVIIGWENLTDKNGKEIPCTKENKVLLMTLSKKFLNFVVESLKTLSEDEAILEEAQTKNSSPSPSGTPGRAARMRRAGETYRAANFRLPGEPKKKKVNPPCKKCRVELDPENYQIIRVWERCGDEWTTAGANGVKIAVGGPSIETAMNVSGIEGCKRTFIFDRIKMISRVIARETIKQRMEEKENEN